MRKYVGVVDAEDVEVFLLQFAEASTEVKFIALTPGVMLAARCPDLRGMKSRSSRLTSASSLSRQSRPVSRRSANEAESKHSATGSGDWPGSKKDESLGELREGRSGRI